jgi:hypothetical protein
MKTSEALKLQGSWWIPGNQNDQFHGALEISQRGRATLEMFANADNQLLTSGAQIQTIYGLTQNGKVVTLINCLITRSNLSSPGMLNASLVADVVLFGINTDLGFSIPCSEVIFNVEKFAEWTGITGAKVTNNWQRGQHTIKYTLPKVSRYKVTKNLTVSIVFNALLPMAGNVRETKVSQDSAIKLMLDPPLLLEEVFLLLYRLNSFFCFAYDEPTALTSVSIFSPKFTALSRGNPQQLQLDVFYPSTPDPDTVPVMSAFTGMLPFNAIEKRFGKVIAAWLINYKSVEPSLEAYFAATMAKHSSLETRFLALVQGLESLHRRSSKATTMSMDEFKSLMKNLIAACPENRKEWLKNRLNYANELSLRQRLKDLLKPYAPFFQPQPKELINSIVVTRNYLTHFDKSLESSAQSNGNLWRICQKLEALFELQILHRLNFTENEIQAIISNNFRLKQKLQA